MVRPAVSGDLSRARTLHHRAGRWPGTVTLQRAESPAPPPRSPCSSRCWYGTTRAWSHSSSMQHHCRTTRRWRRRSRRAPATDDDPRLRGRARCRAAPISATEMGFAQTVRAPSADRRSVDAGRNVITLSGTSAGCRTTCARCRSSTSSWMSSMSIGVFRCRSGRATGDVVSDLEGVQRTEPDRRSRACSASCRRWKARTRCCDHHPHRARPASTKISGGWIASTAPAAAVAPPTVQDANFRVHPRRDLARRSLSEGVRRFRRSRAATTSGAPGLMPDAQPVRST